MAQKLNLTYNDLYVRVSEFLGLGSSPTGDDLTKVKNIVKRGLRQFYYPAYLDQATRKMKPYTWSFLKQLYTFTTIKDLWKYALPNDFSEIITDLSYEAGETYPQVKQRLPEQIIEERAASDSSGYPEIYAVVPVRYDNITGTFYELWLYPTPDASYSLQFFYKIDPLEPVNDSDNLPGSVKAAEAILECCLAVAELQEDDVVGIHNQTATKLIQELILHDRAPVTDRLGNLHSVVREWPKERGEWTTIKEKNIYSDS